MKATQEEVFQRVGVEAVRNALDGYNSTIFAYGQVRACVFRDELNSRPNH